MNTTEIRYVKHTATTTHSCADCHAIILPAETYYIAHPVLATGEIERYGTFSIVCEPCKQEADHAEKGE